MRKNNLKILPLIFIISVSLMFISCKSPDYIGDYESGNETAPLGNALKIEDREDRFTFLKEGCKRYATNYKGIFYITLGERTINYFDYSTGESSVWCSNVGCGHNSSACTAYVGDESEYQYVEWYKGKVYKIDRDDQGVYVSRYDEDGSNGMRIANLMEAYPSGVRISIGRIYDGKLYYTAKKEDNTVDVCSADLNEKDRIQTVFTIAMDDIVAGGSGIYINDSGIYVSMSRYKTDQSGKRVFQRMIYRYDPDSGDFSAATGSEDISASCANDKMYYLTKDNRLFCIAEKGKESEVHAGLFNELPYNDYNIYCNERYIVFERWQMHLMSITGQNADLYVYDIEKDRLSRIKEADAHEASEENGSEDGSKEDISIDRPVTPGDILRPKDRKVFSSLQGLSGRYAFVTSTQYDSMYLIDLDSGEINKADIMLEKDAGRRSGI